MPLFVASIYGRSHLPTLFHLPATVPNYIRDQSVLEKRARHISSQLRSLPNMERLIFRHGLYEEPEILQFVSVLSDWPKLRRIDATSDVVKCLATLKHPHSQLPAVNTPTIEWTWRSKILQNDLVFWSKTLRDLTLIVCFVQTYGREVADLMEAVPN